MTDEKSKNYTSSSAQWRKLKSRARELRHDATPAEDKLWTKLRGRQLNGAKFRRQHTIEGFIVDFVCIERKLVVEVDGAIHDDEDQKDRDAERQQIIEAHGFRVVRFTNEAVLNKLSDVLSTLALALDEEND